MKLFVICPGRSKGSPYHDAIQMYLKRINPAVQVEEIYIKGEKNPSRLNQLENEKIKSLIPQGATIIALDPLGKEMTSPAFANHLQQLKNQSVQQLCFVIGGAEGLSDDIKKAADMTLSFGQATWPHLLARVMLLEQLYRAQQILSGHPYHKE